MLAYATKEGIVSDQLVIVIGIKLIMGFIAAFTSVLLWSKTRDRAWLTMVMGVVFLYLDTLLEILDSFGFVMYKSLYYGEIGILPLIFGILPYICFSIGMLFFLLRVRKY